MMMTVHGIVGRVKCACLVAVDHTCRDLAEISAVRPRRDLADELVGVCRVRGSSDGSRAFGSRLVILHVHSSCVPAQTKKSSVPALGIRAATAAMDGVAGGGGVRIRFRRYSIGFRRPFQVRSQVRRGDRVARHQPASALTLPSASPDLTTMPWCRSARASVSACLGPEVVPRGSVRQPRPAKG